MSQETRSTPPRPTSPHLSIYRPQISSVMSILHRITGIALFLGTIVVVVWLGISAYAPANYIAFHGWLTSIFGRLLMIGWTIAFYYHLCNGIRHLFWDAGFGFDLPVMKKSGIAVLASTAILTALTWGTVFSAGGQ